MPGTGKYTSYVGGGTATAAHSMLSKLFSGGPFAKYVANADEQGVLKDVIIPLATAKVDAEGVGGLQPSDGIQHGDGNMGLGVVRLDFTGAPELADVNHSTAITPSGIDAGGPANAYVPDITSPGPGKTDGLDKVADPMIAPTDLPGKEGYVAGGPATSTRSPAVKSTAIAQHNVLGDTSSTAAKLGDSGANG